MSFNCWKIRKMCGFALLSFYPINSIRKISNYFEWNGGLKIDTTGRNITCILPRKNTPFSRESIYVCVFNNSF